ncbi:serine hydrolase domain-containing protein [Streptomyces sp. NPDC059063]|uniref:serine hydrolase domain-containing protein n=1 Tax=unclassified Streptomyces TaxID=2593676 RepID=UPI0036BACEC5
MTTPKPARLRLAAATALAATAAAVLPAASATAAPTPVPKPAPLTQKQLQHEAERILKKAGYVGVSVQVRDGRRRLHAAAGEAELGTGRPVRHAAPFRAASLTKSFVATVVLQLVAEKQLSLDDTVDRWLPGVVDGNGNDGSRITVRHLLQHTSGIYNYDLTEDTGAGADDFERTRFDHHDPSELVTGAMRHKPDFPPADPGDPAPRWNYSNPGYVVAGMIVEKVTGKTWDEQVRDRIARPLGLKHTYAPGDDPRVPGAYAHAYHQFPGSRRWVDTSVRNMSWAGPAGALITDENDADRFLTALYTGRLLPAAQLKEMRRTVPAKDFQDIFPGLHYGLGAMRQPLSCGGYRWGHGGDLEGQTVRTAVSADGRRSVVLNATGKKADEAWLTNAEKALQGLVDRAMCAPSR